MHKRISRTAVLAAAPAAVAAMLAASITHPPQASADVGGCVNTNGVEVCGSADVAGAVNDVVDVIPNVKVPNFNLPNVKVNPGHVGRPGRGR